MLTALGQKTHRGRKGFQVVIEINLQILYPL